MGEFLFQGNYVRNLLGAPGIIEDIIAHRPASALPGTLFVSTDTKELYRFNGATWDEIGGGVVATPTWQQTLIAGSTLTQNNTIDNGVFHFLMEATGGGSFEFKTFNADMLLNDTGWTLNTTYFNVNDAVDGSYLTFESGTLKSLANSGITMVSGGGTSTMIDSSHDVDIFAENDVLINTAGGAFVNMYNDGHIDVIASGGNISLLANNGDVIIDGQNGVNIAAATGNVTISAPAGVIRAANILEATTGIIIDVAQIISYLTSAAAPGTSVVVLPTTIYGGSAALMGAPTYWIDCEVAGNPGKIPVYT